MRYLLIALSALLWVVNPATAQVSFGVAMPGLSIGVNVPTYPELVPVPGYPVYYAPRLNSNFFFYDGMYWVYQGDNWYASSWYNGPWNLVAPEAVPVYVLRVPVRYYRAPPPYFRGWRADAAPRWGQHWGPAWEQRNPGWDHWNRSAVPRAAPVPYYQRQYSGNRYPQALAEQQTLHEQNYRYRPQDATVQQHYQQQRPQGAPAYSGQQRAMPSAAPPSAQPYSGQQRAMPSAAPPSAQPYSGQQRAGPPPSAQPIGKPAGGD
jgi:hypothetical protein